MSPELVLIYLCASIGFTACPGFVDFARSDTPNRCRRCGRKSKANEMFEVLAPINSTTR